VQGAAERLEHALKEQAPMEVVAPLVDALDEVLAPLLAAIGAQLPGQPQQPAAAPMAVDDAQLASVTTRLRELLDDMDADAGTLLQQQAALLGAAFPDHAKAMAEAVESFDFDQAIATLDAALAARQAS